MTAPGCRCDGSGVVVSLNAPCPCTRETLADEMDRVTEQKAELVRTVDELGKVVTELEAERAQLRARVEQLLGHRLLLVGVLEERAAALQAAGNIDGARRLMAALREVADG